MLSELHVHDLGVIAQSRLVLPDGLIALTGETGAGKTLVVEAIDLLLGGRADVGLVREGAREAVIEGRFLDGEDEIVLTRVLPRDGRSRAYVDGRLATAAALTERGRALVDLHGQNAYQSLLAREHQRRAVDRYGAIDLGPLRRARAALVEIDAELASLGGDERARRREIDLLRFQIDEIESAAITDPEEDDRLASEQDRLARAADHREAGWRALAALREDGGARDAIAAARSALSAHGPYLEARSRLDALAAELDDAVDEIRRLTETIEEDPERLATIGHRRALLSELRRKYGESLGDVIEFASEQRLRLERLESYEQRSRLLEIRRDEALAEVHRLEAEIGRRRRAVANDLAAAVSSTFSRLALGHASLSVMIAPETEDPGADTTSFWFRPAPAMSAQPLARIASGGELARTMLALRLVLTDGPATLVFDEVDAGVGGAAALAVADALAAVAQRHQVLVVTHLAQVAARATTHVVVTKTVEDGRAGAEVGEVTGTQRVAEIARMLSGGASSRTALDHAAELLAARIDDSPSASG